MQGEGLGGDLGGVGKQAQNLRGNERVRNLAPAAFGINDAGLLEHAQVLADEWLGLASSLDELVHKVIALGQARDDCDA